MLLLTFLRTRCPKHAPSFSPSPKSSNFKAAKHSTKRIHPFQIPTPQPAAHLIARLNDLTKPPVVQSFKASLNETRIFSPQTPPIMQIVSDGTADHIITKEKLYAHLDTFIEKNKGIKSLLLLPPRHHTTLLTSRRNHRLPLQSIQRQLPRPHHARTRHPLPHDRERMSQNVWS